MTDASSLPPPPPPFLQPRGATAIATGLWGRFRSWHTWVQLVVGVILLPVVLLVFTLTRPPEGRNKWWALTAVVAVIWVGAAVTPDSPDTGTRVAATDDTTATTERRTTTTRERQTTTTLADAPEGGARSGNGNDVTNDSAAVDSDAFERASATNDLLYVLASLTVEPEPARSGYNRDLFDHWDDDDGDRCDTRCEVLSAQRGPDGFWLSAWDGYSTNDPSELHVDHVVALAEAWDSGADEWSGIKRDEFADYMPNLLAVSAASNLSKSDKDAAEWFPSRAEANCLWASTVVRVKDHWDLSVDQAEADALGNLLRTCGDYVAPTTTTTRPPTTTTRPRTTTTAAAPPPPSSNCSGYDPCIPPGDDVDCAGGSGNGPRYVDGPVYVDHSYGDPYGLDSDGDGVGCEN